MTLSLNYNDDEQKLDIHLWMYIILMKAKMCKICATFKILNWKDDICTRFGSIEKIFSP